MNRPLGYGWPERKQRLVSATLALLQSYAGRAEAEMKATRSWTDRTSLARQGLTARVAVDASVQGASLIGQAAARRMSLVLAHSVDYGKWLETVNGAAMGRRRFMSSEQLQAPENAGNFAVIIPTARRIGPSLGAAVRRVWSRSLI